MTCWGDADNKWLPLKNHCHLQSVEPFPRSHAWSHSIFTNMQTSLTIYSVGTMNSCVTSKSAHVHWPYWPSNFIQELPFTSASPKKKDHLSSAPIDIGTYNMAAMHSTPCWDGNKTVNGVIDESWLVFSDPGKLSWYSHWWYKHKIINNQLWNDHKSLGWGQSFPSFILGKVDHIQVPSSTNYSKLAYWNSNKVLAHQTSWPKSTRIIHAYLSWELWPIYKWWHKNQSGKWNLLLLKLFDFWSRLSRHEFQPQPRSFLQI